MSTYRIRRLVLLIIALIVFAIPLSQTQIEEPIVPIAHQSRVIRTAQAELAAIAIKGRAPKTGYSRELFGGGWDTEGGCDTRNRILARDLRDVKVNDSCKVLSGVLNDPYTGAIIQFQRGADTSDDVQIDHVVALSNAWQTGAQSLTYSTRVQFANDPLNLLAVDGLANEQKSDSDAATWLPPNKSFRCQYTARQVQVKARYKLWVTQAEKQTIEDILSRCK